MNNYPFSERAKIELNVCASVFPHLLRAAE